MTELGQVLSVVLAHAQSDIEAVIHWDGAGWYAAVRVENKDVYTRVSTEHRIEPDAYALRAFDLIWCNWPPFYMTVH